MYQSQNYIIKLSNTAAHESLIKSLQHLSCQTTSPLLLYRYQYTTPNTVTKKYLTVCKISELNSHYKDIELQYSNELLEKNKYHADYCVVLLK